MCGIALLLFVVGIGRGWCSRRLRVWGGVVVGKEVRMMMVKNKGN